MTRSTEDPIGGAHPTGSEADLEDEYQMLDPGTTATGAPTSGPAPADGSERADHVSGVEAEDGPDAASADRDAS